MGNSFVFINFQQSKFMANQTSNPCGSCTHACNKKKSILATLGRRLSIIMLLEEPKQCVTGPKLRSN